MSKDEALRLALEALETHVPNVYKDRGYAPITAIKQALEETQSVSPDEEPVAWGVDWGKAGDSTCVSIIKRLPGGGIEVVAVEYGPKREWQGLTDEEVGYIADEYATLQGALRAIEAKLKEKNT